VGDDLPSVYGGIRAKPVTHEGVEMDSGTEAAFARWVKHYGNTWRYHRRFSGVDGVYELDFEAICPIGTVYTEIKPRTDEMPGWLYENREQVDGWLRKLERVRESIPDASLALVFWSGLWEPADPNLRIPPLFFLNRGQRWRLIRGGKVEPAW